MKYDGDAVVQRGIASPSAADQEHLLLIRLDITGSIFEMGVEEAKIKVRDGLKRLCLLFERIQGGEKTMDELDSTGMIVSRKLADRPPNGFNFSATIGFGASFFEQLKVNESKRPNKLREMPDNKGLGDVTPYSLGQTDMIIQLGSTKDFVNHWVLENTVQPAEDEIIKKLLKKQNEGKLYDEAEKSILAGLLNEAIPEGSDKLNSGERYCTDGQRLWDGEEECIPDIATAIQGWATITDLHAGFQRIDGRNLQGFNDGVSNPKPGDEFHETGLNFDKIVFLDEKDGNAQFEGGTYMVFQKIEHDLDQWRALSLDEQQEWVGRSKGTGLLLGTLEEEEDRRLARNLRSPKKEIRDEAAYDIKQLLKVQMNPETRFFNENANAIDVAGKQKVYRINPKEIRKKVPAWSHVRKANPRREDNTPQIMIFRRGYPYIETDLNNKIRSGLLFVCFQRDIELGFEYIKKTFFNDKNFPVPSRRFFTENELNERHKHGRFSVPELKALSPEGKKVLGLDGERYDEALKESGVVEPDINKDFTSRDIDMIDHKLVPDSQNTGREGLAGPSENGIVPTGEFLAIVPLGGGYYFVPPIPNKRLKDIGQSFFE